MSSTESSTFMARVTVLFVLEIGFKQCKIFKIHTHTHTHTHREREREREERERDYKI